MMGFVFGFAAPTKCFQVKFGVSFRASSESGLLGAVVVKTRIA